METYAKKQFKFRGKTLEELKALSVREFAKLTKSRQRRTILRQFQKIENFVSRAKTKLSKKKAIKTHLRDIIIVPQLIGMKILVYNGKDFVPVLITEEMLGHFLGEFSLTRTRVKHGSAGVGATKGTRSQSKH
jgi:small subunit ribosomal protein S19